MSAGARDEQNLLDGDELSQNNAEDEEEVEEDTRSPLPVRRMPSRERHITDMHRPRTLSVSKRKAFLKKTLFVAFVAFVGFLVILFTVVALIYAPTDQVDTCQNVESGRYLFDPYTSQENFRLCHSKEAKLTGRLGQAITGMANTSVNRERAGSFTFTDPSVSWSLTLNATGECVSVIWTGETSHGLPLKDCYDMSGSYWYGGYEAYDQLWPINNSSRQMQPFLSNDTYLYQFQDSFGPILHPVWLNSKGVLVFVEKTVPLHVSINALPDSADANDASSSGDKQLCLESVPYALGCTPIASQNAHLSYTVCQFEDAVVALKHFLQTSGQVKAPSSIPESEVFKRPIWSTRTLNKDDLNEELVLAYANKIVGEHFPISQLEIDDGYFDLYGDLSVSNSKFPHSFKNIVELGVQNQFNVTAWVHPFVNYDSGLFKNITEQELNHLLPGGSKETTAIVKWWRGHGALINFEFPETTAWYKEKLQEFVDTYKLASLKFDAGESEYLPDCLYFPDSTHPATYTQQYIAFAASFNWSSRAEVRVGYFTQEYPIFVRMLDRNSTWGTDNGLHSVVTTALTMSMMGYNFIIPDMIGGNMYNARVHGEVNLASGKPEKELYVRWLQLSVFLPVMQFSIPPWVYNDTELAEYAKKLISYHECFTKTYILPAANQILSQMCPLLRPVWWLDPLSDEAHRCNDEFLVGNSILVAPILHKGDTSREVYFPPGTWKQCLCNSGGKEECKDEKSFIVEDGSYSRTITLGWEPPFQSPVYFKRQDASKHDC